LSTGDLILIDDELKTRNINCGRILDIDVGNRKLTLSNPYDNTKFNSIIELYTPTGFKTRQELFDIATSQRSRVGDFTLTGPASVNAVTGKYIFSNYNDNGAAFYTGYNDASEYNIFCYYDIDESSWVFSTGFAYRRNNIYDKFISNNMEFNDLIDITLSDVYVYKLGLQKTTSRISIKSNLSFNNSRVGGIYDNEIKTEGSRQITKYQISGITTNTNDGSVVYLDENNFNLNLLSIIEPGSPYRIGISNSNNQIYKVISVREESQNEYLIVATKYDSGKWSAIENDSFIENSQQSFYNKDTANKVVSSLGTPTNLYLDAINETSTKFDITGSFDHASSVQFKITVENKAVGFKYEVTTGAKEFIIKDLNDLGRYDMTVTAISTSSINLNSYPAKTQKFIGYQKTDISLYDRPFIENFTIL
jgi:hypothetical protein